MESTFSIGDVLNLKTLFDEKIGNVRISFKNQIFYLNQKRTWKLFPCGFKRLKSRKFTPDFIFNLYHFEYYFLNFQNGKTVFWGARKSLILTKGVEKYASRFGTLWASIPIEWALPNSRKVSQRWWFRLAFWKKPFSTRLHHNIYCPNWDWQ